MDNDDHARTKSRKHNAQALAPQALHKYPLTAPEDRQTEFCHAPVSKKCGQSPMAADFGWLSFHMRFRLCRHECMKRLYEWTQRLFTTKIMTFSFLFLSV